MNNRITLFLIAIVVVASFTAYADQFNERDKNILVIPIGSFAAGEADVGDFVVRMPQACKIDAVYFTANGAIAKDGTNNIAVTLAADGSTIGTFLSSTTAVVDDTPVALTLTSSPVSVAADSILKAAVAHGGNGKQGTDTAIIIHYHNAN